MNEPKRHHYVPSSYQELFRNQETNELYRLDKVTGKSTRHNPDNKLFKNHLYTLENPPADVHRTYIEKPLLSKLDGRFKDAIVKMTNDIGNIDKSTLAVCVSFLRNRTPSRIQEFGEHASQNKLIEIYEHIKSSPEEIEKAKLNGCNLTTFEDFKVSLQGITVSAGKDYNLQGFLLSSSLQSADFFEMQWTLLISNSKSFITSDKPVTAVEECDEDNCKTSQYYLIPLSSKFCIKIYFFEGSLDIHEVEEDEVDEINKAIAFCAESLIVGPSEQDLHRIFKEIAL
ncbi:DUF4238 domain-containing protein [Pseudomonas reactans]|uniref:DUF4238 domain-containing protein n=1 Tax=Pseudomonas reactans TaxID=117680 RepID=UPI00159FB442|nr:DUF4238 domain-containing protein [Pseudomonas reactans]NWF15668.1 DUF4238 domain-containing protein [Pseudomonas reactans]